jgi:SAM-dependent methyltransferase
MPDPATAFCRRAGVYARFRPGYPEALAVLIERELGLPSQAVIADIGAGTGISAELFLRRGHTVYAIDPNAEMQAECMSRLGSQPGLRCVEATAEATGLAAGTVDMIVAAQAFHWFEAEATRREWLRILRDPGRVALFWNVRLTEASEFAVVYEALLTENCPVYGERYYRQIRAGSEIAAASESAAALFGNGRARTAAFSNDQILDFEAFEGRVFSSSYAPLPGSPESERLRHRLSELFDRFQQNGFVRIEYSTQVWWGFLHP